MFGNLRILEFLSKKVVPGTHENLFCMKFISGKNFSIELRKVLSNLKRSYEQALHQIILSLVRRNNFMFDR